MAETDTPLPFERALERLEEIVTFLEHERPSLEDALSAYEEGVLLARQCMERLQTAELHVQELSLEE